MSEADDDKRRDRSPETGAEDALTAESRRDPEAEPTRDTEEDAVAEAPRAPEDEEDAGESVGIQSAIVAEIVEALEEGDRPRALTLIEEYHEADVADLLEQLPSDDRRLLIETLGADLDASVLTELDESIRDEVLGYLAPDYLAEAVKELETDDVVYLVEDLAPEARGAVLDALDAAERAAVEESLAYPDYSAGRLMQREMVWAPAFLTVGEMIDRMRSTEDLPEQFYEIMIVDPTFKPVGKVALSRVMAAKRPVRLDQLMMEDFTVFRVDQPQEEVGYAFNQYHLVSAPVVDEGGRLVGVITIDDAMQALDEEAEEDLLRLGGVGDESLGEAAAKIAWRRFPWLAVNLGTAVLASLVIGLFDDAIAQVVALAILMPIVASMGGNAGTQTLTVAVRALATKDLTSTNAIRIIARETLVGLSNGVAFAVIVGIIGYLWFGDPRLGGVLAASMVINLLIAGLAGILIPLWLEKAGADPALASAVFVTTVTDVVGFFAFLGIAALVLL